MRFILSEAEIARACVKYVSGKNTSDDSNHEYRVTIQWHGKKAVVEATPKVIPTLTTTA